MSKKVSFREKVDEVVRDFKKNHKRTIDNLKKELNQEAEYVKTAENNLVELSRQKLSEAKKKVSDEKAHYVGREYLISTIESLKFSSRVLRGRVLKVTNGITPSDFHKMSDNLLDIDDAFRYLKDVFTNNRNLVSPGDMEIIGKIGDNLLSLGDEFSNFVIDSRAHPEARIIELCTKIESECEDLRHHAVDYFKMVS